MSNISQILRINQPRNNLSNEPLALKICILGGGFGGLYTALYLRHFLGQKLPNCQITLVDRKDHFLFTPLLYELVTGELQPWEIAPSFKKLLNQTNIQFCQANIEAVDLEKRQVKLQNRELLTYDYLVLALGGETKLDGVPGAATYAIPFRTLADTKCLKERLRFLEASAREQIRVAVVGGGPSGVELAGKLADRLQKRGHVLLIERGDQILKSFSPAVRAAAYCALKVRDVQVELATSIKAIAPDRITLVRQGHSTDLAVDLVLWTGGTRSLEWVRQLNCQHNSQGQLIARPTLQLIDYPEVFVLGDMAEIRDRTGRVPATAQATFQQAACVARNLKAILRGRPLKHFRYLHLGDMLTLGTQAAVVSSFGINIEGRLACVTRQLVYLQRLPTFSHRLQVVRHWLVSWCLYQLSWMRHQLARLFLKEYSSRQRLLESYSQRHKY